MCQLKLECEVFWKKADLLFQIFWENSALGPSTESQYFDNQTQSCKIDTKTSGYILLHTIFRFLNERPKLLISIK